MRRTLFTALAFAAMTTFASAEPMQLTSLQMDAITAGTGNSTPTNTTNTTNNTAETNVTQSITGSPQINICVLAVQCNQSNTIVQNATVANSAGGGDDTKAESAVKVKNNFKNVLKIKKNNKKYVKRHRRAGK